MKRYFADTNIFLRFILDDIHQQAQQAERYFTLAKKGEIEIVVATIVVFEIFFNLKRIYRFSKNQSTTPIKDLLAASYFLVEDHQLFDEALRLYEEKNADFVDAYLFAKAEAQAAEVLSFDKDFKKLKNQPRPRTLEEG